MARTRRVRRNPDRRYRVIFQADGWVYYYVNASSAEEAIELAEAGQWDEEEFELGDLHTSEVEVEEVGGY